MNLLNKVKQGMLDSTKAIKGISSDMTELTKVKICLSKDLAKIDELYYTLGEKMYTAYEENTNMDLSEDIDSALMELKSTFERIKEYELKIESLKGIIKCTKCHYEVDEDAKYCSNCGNKITYIPSKEISDESSDKTFLNEKTNNILCEDNATPNQDQNPE